MSICTNVGFLHSFSWLLSQSALSRSLLEAGHVVPPRAVLYVKYGGGRAGQEELTGPSQRQHDDAVVLTATPHTGHTAWRHHVAIVWFSVKNQSRHYGGSPSRQCCRISARRSRLSRYIACSNWQQSRWLAQLHHPADSSPGRFRGSAMRAPGNTGNHWIFILFSWPPSFKKLTCIFKQVYSFYSALLNVS